MKRTVKLYEKRMPKSISLTHVMPLVWKTRGFPKFSGFVETDLWQEWVKGLKKSKNQSWQDAFLGN